MARCPELRSLVAIGLLAAVLLRVWIGEGAGSGALEGEAGLVAGTGDLVGWASWMHGVVSPAGAAVDADCGGADCVDCDDCGDCGDADVGAAAAGCDAAANCGVGAAAISGCTAVSPPVLGAGSSSSLSLDSYTVDWVMGG